MLPLRRTVALVAMLATALAAPRGAQDAAVASGTATAIRQAVEPQPALRTLYEPAGFAPLWLDSSGALNGSARDALRLLAWAPADGLDPSDYASTDIDAQARLLGSSGPEARAQLDVALSENLLRYMHDLHAGRVAPRDLGFMLDVPPEGDDVAALVRDAAARRQLIELARALTPHGQPYQALSATLAQYRELALVESSAVLPPVTKPVRPGDAYAALPALRARLLLLGDLDAALPVGDAYDGALVAAVSRFQRRHVLDSDGVLGAKTIAELNVPLAARIRQLEFAMEQQRWVQQLTPGSRLVVVNIPTFRLSAWDAVPPGGAPAFTSRVIVGRPVTPTPVVGGTLSEVTFRPYWNVPTSIVRKEVLPTLARQPDYLERERLELVAGQSDDSPVVASTPENLALLGSGRVRLRQRQGADNALGLIKFTFRNPFDVYMHATPAPLLFAQSSRAFSHGCIRLQDPVGLGVWVLGSGWDRERLTAAMNAPQSSRVAVKAPPLVWLMYSTADVLLDSGEVIFAPDIYGHDARIDALIRPRAAATPPQ